MKALHLALQCMTQSGDLVAIESPVFYASLQVLKPLKLRTVEIPVHPREGIDLEVLAERLHCSSLSKCLAPGYRISWVANEAWKHWGNY